MSSEGSYYVPEQSKLPLAAATGMGVMGYGAASWVIDGGTSTIFLIGSLIMAVVMYRWWSLVIEENTQGIVSDQLKHSYVLGMYWFIFSELMFFVCFFGSLFYVRVLVGPWLGGEAAIGLFDDTATDAAIANATHLWPGYDATWPPLVTPDQVATLVTALEYDCSTDIKRNGAYRSSRLKRRQPKKIRNMVGFDRLVRRYLFVLAGRRVYSRLPGIRAYLRVGYLWHDLLFVDWIPWCSCNVGNDHALYRFSSWG
jgi:hypothetical protein